MIVGDLQFSSLQRVDTLLPGFGFFSTGSKTYLAKVFYENTVLVPTQQIPH